MSTPGLFIAGVLVTLILLAALALLIYAAVLDGRYDAARRAGQPAPQPAQPGDRELAAAP